MSKTYVCPKCGNTHLRGIVSKYSIRPLKLECRFCDTVFDVPGQLVSNYNIK